MYLNSIFGKNRSFVSRQIAPVTMISLFSCVGDYAASIIGTIIVGGAFSETGLVVTGITLPIATLIILICDMFAGSAVFLRNVSIAEGNEEKGARLLGSTLILITTIGCVMSALMYFGADFYVSFFNLSEETVAVAASYVRAISLHAILYILQYYFYEIMFRMEAKLPMISMVLTMSFGVAVLGLWFINLFGIVGMAYATVLADVISVLIGLFTVLAHRKEIKLSFKFSKPEFLEQLEFGFSYSQDSLYYPIYSTILNIFIATRFGESCIAVFAIIECITEFSALFYGVSYAAGNYVSIYVGEENDDGLKKVNIAAICIQTIIAVAAMVLCLIFAEPIANYMGMEEAYNVETILAVRIYALGFIPMAYLCYLCDYYCELEKFGSCIVACFTNTIVAGLGISILLGCIFGAIGVYIGKTISPVIALTVVIVYNRKKYKVKDPLMVKDTSHIKSFDYAVTQEAIMSTRDLVEAELIKRGVPQAVILKALLAFEESNMLTLDNNKRQIYAECTLIFKEDSFDMIIRDDGMLTDFSDVDRDITSLRSYLISTIVQKSIPTRHIYAAHVNRLTYRFNFHGRI